MDIFTTDLIPEMIAIEKEFRRQVKLATNELLAAIKNEAVDIGLIDENENDSLDTDLVDRMFMVEIRRRIEGELKYIHIFHRLEYLSIYINQELVIDDVVYPGLNNTLLKFMNTHKQLFYEIQKEEGCFKSLQKLYEEWTQRKKSENN